MGRSFRIWITGLLTVIFLFAGAAIPVITNPSHAVAQSQSEIDSLKEQVASLQQAVTDLRAQTLQVGYINVQGCFSVFWNAVQDERDKVKQKQKELLELQKSLQQGDISESNYRQQRDLLQAQRLLAEFEVDLSMIEQMIDAQGYQSISDQLTQLRDRIEPAVSQLSELTDQIENSAVPPQEAEGMLQNVSSYYDRVDQTVTQVITSKIFQITNAYAEEEGYDLVIKEQNIIIYKDNATIQNLTDKIKKRLEIGLQN